MAAVTPISKASGARSMGPTKKIAKRLTADFVASNQKPLMRVPRGGYIKDDGTYDAAADKGNTPAEIYPYDPYDTYYQLKSQVLKEGLPLTDGKGGAVAQNYTVTDRDIDYIASKQEAQTLAQFEAWISTLYNFKDPAQVKLFKEMYPEYYKRRENVIDNIAEQQARYAKLMLTGPQNLDDAKFMYKAQIGLVPLISGPLWNPSEWFKTDATNMQLALFNPWKVLGALKDGKDQHIPVPGGQGGDYVTPGIPGKVTVNKTAASPMYNWYASFLPGAKQESNYITQASSIAELFTPTYV